MSGAAVWGLVGLAVLSFWTLVTPILIFAYLIRRALRMAALGCPWCGTRLLERSPTSLESAVYSSAKEARGSALRSSAGRCGACNAHNGPDMLMCEHCGQWLQLHHSGES